MKTSTGEGVIQIAKLPFDIPYISRDYRPVYNILAENRAKTYGLYCSKKVTETEHANQYKEFHLNAHE